jgi:hypothetical protein
MKTTARTIRILALAALLAAVPATVHAQIIVHPTIEASADTYIDAGTSNHGTNKGNLDYISVRKTAGTSPASTNRNTWLQFDLDTLSLDAPVTKATLTLTLSADIPSGRASASNLQLWGIAFASDAAALALNLETTFTNDNAPWAAGPNGDTPPSSLTNATGILGQVAIPLSSAGDGTKAGDTLTLQSDPALVSFLETVRLNPNLSIVTFVLTESTGNAGFVSFASKEHATYAGPTLELTTGTIPEPATIAALAGLAALGLVVLIRRRATTAD